MAQTNRRQTQGVRRQARAQENTRRVRKARSQGRSVFGYLLGLLPFTDDQLRRAFTVLILVVAAMLAWVVAEISGATTYASQRLALATANAGYVVRQVELRGVERINGMAIRERALSQPDLAMATYDIDALRTELLAMPWVKDARVARQLPDVLVIDIIERTPHAVARRADRLMLVDAEGVDLEPVRSSATGNLMMLDGLPDPSRGNAEERANLQEQVRHQVTALTALLDAAPALRSQVRGAEWVGNRRWNLTFGTGQNLALPEGEDRAAAALIAFAQADGVHRLIGGEVASFDMRNPPRMFMRVPGRAEAQELAVVEEQS